MSNPIFPIFMQRRPFGDTLEIAPPDCCAGTIVAHVMQLEGGYETHELVGLAVKAFARQTEAWMQDLSARRGIDSARLYASGATEQDLRSFGQAAASLLYALTQTMQATTKAVGIDTTAPDPEQDELSAATPTEAA